ncbi:MAG: hypothetical protein ACOVMQ_07705 [Cyclobacteriaceae bacterium]|jgi:hypothetical protein
MRSLGILIFVLMSWNGAAQPLFADRCVGTWKGMMHIYHLGKLRDSVEVKLTVAAEAVHVWTWRMEYLSAKMPMVKDYKLRLKDVDKNLYVTDEGGGLELTDYLTENKLYSIFETQGIMLTSEYELRGDELIFEVTSGKKETISHPEVSNYSTTSVQRVTLKRVK